MLLNQGSFFDPEFACPGSVRPGSVAWLLARHRGELFPEWLLKGWRGQRLGRKAWPARVLVSLLLLRWSEEGMSRLASVERARTDASWRAALGLSLDSSVPSERTVRDFERFMRSRHADVGQPRYLLLHEQIVRLCLERGIGRDKAIWATDSTPMWCYGAVLDTVRLLGDGLRSLALRWGRAMRLTLDEVAKRWEMPWLLAKSTKGGLSLDWRDPERRARGLERLARDVLHAVRFVRRGLSTARQGFRKSLLSRCRRLLRVVRDDLEEDADGRLVVVRGVAKDRMVSFTEPQARYGHKTRKRTFKGFKLHVVGDVVSGLIAAVGVTPGSFHDSKPAHRLFRRASDLLDGLDLILADTAYGAAGFRRSTRELLGIELLAPPPPGMKPKNDRFSKNDFEVDLPGGTALCPNGELSEVFTTVQANGGLSRRHVWSRHVCDQCPIRDKCLPAKTRKRALLLHPEEHELREARRRWSQPEVRAAYRTRSQCERLINQVVRHGARKARAWGLGYAHTQAHLIVTVCNMGLLARHFAEPG